MARCKALLLFCFAVFFSGTSSAAEHYSAQYRLFVHGINAGIVRQETNADAEQYHIQAMADPSFLASLLGYDELLESAAGRIVDGRLQPEYYRREMKGHQDEFIDYRYDGANHTIDARIGKQKMRMNYHAPAPLDMFSLTLQMLMDIAAGQVQQQYDFADKGAILSFHVRELPMEKMRDDAGRSFNVRVFQLKDGEKMIQGYFADAPLRMVRLVYRKQGKEALNLELMSYRRL